ncbi:MAG: hypothetical protein DRP45_10595, partial [Candidatus Zixiibacteriota bacterium]
CGDDKPTENTPPPTTVGPNGGTVTGIGGASVVIPAGALSAETAITVTTCSDESSLPSSLGIFDFLGAVDFGPDGQEFAVPVTITIPCPTPMTPGSQFPLLYFDDAEDLWVQSLSVATVSGDGQSYSGQVSHFTVWTGGDIGPDGLFDDFVSDLGDGSNGQGALDLYMIYFIQNIAEVGDIGIHGGQCHEVVGINFDVAYQIDGVPGSFYEPMGDVSGDNVFLISYKLDRVTITTSTWFDLGVGIFFKCVPVLEVAASPSRIDVEETSTVTATLTCNSVPMPGRQITFEAAGGLGTLSPTTATTAGNGQAQTTFTAGSDEGREAILTHYTACEGRSTQNTEIASASIDIGDLGSSTLNLTFHHSGDGVSWVFDDAITINFDLNIEENTITGSGTGSQNLSVVMVGSEVCDIASQYSSSFEVAIVGSVVGDYLDFQVFAASLPVGFTVHCDTDPPIPDVTVSVYSNLLASIMGQNIFLHVLNQSGATDSGSGSEGFGEDIPINYTYSVTLN